MSGWCVGSVSADRTERRTPNDDMTPGVMVDAFCSCHCASLCMYVCMRVPPHLHTQATADWATREKVVNDRPGCYTEKAPKPAWVSGVPKVSQMMETDGLCGQVRICVHCAVINPGS